MTKFVILCIIIFAAADAAKNNGLSPNGKATDSDSVIFKVRILVAQLKSNATDLPAGLHYISDWHFPPCQAKSDYIPDRQTGI